MTTTEIVISKANSIRFSDRNSDDPFEALDLQDQLQTKYTGGTVFHTFLGEKINDIETVKSFVKKIAIGYKMPYFTLSPTFSVCPIHGYLSGEHKQCPKCLVEQQCEVYSEIVS
jgi:ribonucleoside-triphosphate reductase